MKYVIGVILLLLGIVLIILGYVNKSHQSYTPEPIISDIPTIPSPTVIKSAPLYFSAFINTENEKDTVQSLASASALIKEIHPMWYSMNQTGVIQTLSSSSRKEILQLSTEAGIHLMPSIEIHWINTKDNFLVNKEKTFQVVGKITDLIENDSYDGIVIDLRHTTVDTISDFVPWLDKVQNALNSEQKKLYAVIPYQGSYSAETISLIHTLAKVVHRIYVDIPSTETFDEVVNQLSGIHQEPISIVLPLEGTEVYNASATKITYMQAIQQISEAKGSWQRDDTTKELKGNYQKNGSIYSVNFYDAESIKEKISIGRENNFNYFAFQSIGGEDSKIWDVLIQ